jgi:hypothetical protein
MVRASTSPTKEKLFFKISFPSKNLKNAITQSDTKAIGQLVANIIIDKGCKDERIERQPLTRYIKNWADSAKFQVCSSHLTLCGLTVNRSVLPNFSYTHPLPPSVGDRDNDIETLKVNHCERTEKRNIDKTKEPTLKSTRCFLIFFPTHIAHIAKAPRANAETKALSKSAILLFLIIKFGL